MNSADVRTAKPTLASRHVVELQGSGLRSGGLESWLIRNSTWVAIVIITAALAVRIAYSSACYLNPDEALGFNAARPDSWLEAYRASHLLTHPPLFILALHWILPLGRSELLLRLPSIIFGTGALWLIFGWIRRILGEIPALAGLLFMAVSPASISASTEVRQYGLLLFLVCGALYATERALTGQSTRWAIVQGLFLLCALLTHYIALVVIAALDIYILLCSILGHISRRIMLTLAATQLVIAVVLGLIYFRQVRASAWFSREGLAYLSTYYVRPNETLLGFSRRALVGTFSHMVGTTSQKLTYVVVFIFLAGLAALLTSRTRAGRHLGILISLPFLVGFAAALCRLFPFVGTRHQAYLIPFFTLAVAAAFTLIPSRLAVPSLLIGAILAPLWAMSTKPDNNPWIRPRGDMTAAIDYMGRAVPPDTPLFVDEETRWELSYYLGRNDPTLDSLYRHTDNEERLCGHRIISPKGNVWSFLPDEALTQVNESARELGMPPGGSTWMVSVRWQETEPLASLLPRGGHRNVKEFGAISVIQLTPE